MSNLDFLKKFVHDWRECYSLVYIKGNHYKITPLRYEISMYFINSLLREFSPDGFRLTSDRNGYIGIYVDIDKIIPKNKD